MSVHFIKRGNIFKLTGINNYAHGCNCAGAMGKGIALQFKRMFPDMFSTYHRLCLDNKFKPGDVYDYSYGFNYHVYNLGTQEHYSIPGKLAKPKHIRKSLQKMLELASSSGVTNIALPKIGAGLGGLDWNTVKDIILEVSETHPEIELYVVEEFAP